MTAPVINLAERRRELLIAQVDKLNEAFFFALEAALLEAANDTDEANNLEDENKGRVTEQFIDRCIQICEKVRNGE